MSEDQGPTIIVAHHEPGVARLMVDTLTLGGFNVTHVVPRHEGDITGLTGQLTRQIQLLGSRVQLLIIGQHVSLPYLVQIKKKHAAQAKVWILTSDCSEENVTRLTGWGVDRVSNVSDLQPADAFNQMVREFIEQMA